MKFLRTTDWEAIKKIVTHPSVYSKVTDDFSPSPVDWEPVKDEMIWYVLALEDAQVLGLLMFWPDNPVCWKVHMCMLPCAYGDMARVATRGAIEWIFAQTSCRRVVGELPADNKLALRLALNIGMEEYGCNPRSFLKGGRLLDTVLVGISKAGVN